MKIIYSFIDILLFFHQKNNRNENKFHTQIKNEKKLTFYSVKQSLGILHRIVQRNYPGTSCLLKCKIPVDLFIINLPLSLRGILKKFLERSRGFFF